MGRRLQSLASALTGAVAAAGAMYYFDAGHRRRPQLADGAASLARRGFAHLQMASRALAGRLGFRAAALFRGADAPTTALVERVRARLERVISHPQAVQVSVDDDRIVRLSGAVLAWEREPLRRAVSEVPGVGGLRDELQMHESAERCRALQSAVPSRLRGLDDEPRTSTALRQMMALAGSSLLLRGTRRRGALGAVGAAAGGALLLRSVTFPRRASRHRGRSIEVSQTLHVGAPVHSVFAALRQPDRLTPWIPSLRALRHRSDGGVRWMITDPDGWRLEWVAEVTEQQPDRLIAWRSTDDSPQILSGMIWLEPIGDQQTRLQLYLSCRLIPGRTGVALRRLCGSGSDGELAANLKRLRHYLETTARDEAAPATGSDGLTAWTQPVDGRTH